MATALAPPPEFRLVGCAPLEKARAATAASLGFGSAVTALAGALSCTFPQAVFAGISSAAASVLLFRGQKSHVPKGAASVAMTLVPWGVLLDDGARILHWPSIRHVAVRHLFGRDQASDTTLASIVVIETERSSYAACAPGEVHLDRLLAYFGEYAEEAAHLVALDLTGDAATSPVEPVCLALIERVRLFARLPSSDFGCSLRDYRGDSGTILDPKGRSALLSVLSDRTPRRIDPRPLAALLAAEFQVDEAAPLLASLVQSPHPIVAATAKAAALRLGLSSARVGTVDELGPFLAEEDRDALKEWIQSAFYR